MRLALFGPNAPLPSDVGALASDAIRAFLYEKPALHSTRELAASAGNDQLQPAMRLRRSNE
jgi:hypothetical protein